VPPGEAERELPGLVHQWVVEGRVQTMLVSADMHRSALVLCHQHCCTCQLLLCCRDPRLVFVFSSLRSYQTRLPHLLNQQLSSKTTFGYAFGVYTCYASHYSLLMLPSSFEYCPLQGEREDAPLHIGGLRIHCEGDSVFEIAGNRRQKASNAFGCPEQSAYCFCIRIRLSLSAGQETSLYRGTAIIVR